MKKVILPIVTALILISVTFLVVIFLERIQDLNRGLMDSLKISLKVSLPAAVVMILASNPIKK